MNKDHLEVLTIVQQVLRHVVAALAATDKERLGEIGGMLELAASNRALEPMARQMLADLASGITALSDIGGLKQ